MCVCISQVRGLCHGTETLLREAEERASQQHADSLLHRAARNLSMLIDPSGQESWATTVFTGLCKCFIAIGHQDELGRFRQAGLCSPLCPQKTETGRLLQASFACIAMQQLRSFHLVLTAKSCKIAKLLLPKLCLSLSLSLPGMGAGQSPRASSPPDALSGKGE